MLEIGQDQPYSQRLSEGRFWNKFILVFQYLLIGTSTSMVFTIAYTYSDLPSYNILAFFSLVGLIPSFRFLLSPLIENHTSLTYGKRKTWMVICTISIATLLFICSFFTGDHQQITIGCIFAVQRIFLGINQTCTDALALKQYKQKSKMSFLQSTVFRLGGVFGGLIFLKIISKTFCLHFGKTTPLMTVKQYFILISVSFLIIGLLSHFLYKEEEQEAEQIIMQKNYCQLMSQYKVFMDIDNAYSRMLIFFMLIHLGLSCFMSGFRILLITDYGFNRQDFVTISTVMLFVVMPFSYLFSRHIGEQTIALKFQIVLFGRFFFDLLGFIFKFNTIFSLSIFYFFNDGLREFQGILTHTIMNNLSHVGLSGMFLSALGSLKGAIQNHSWSLKLIDMFGFEICCVVGFIQQLGVIYCIPRLINWVDTGERPVEVKESEAKTQDD